MVYLPPMGEDSCKKSDRNAPSGAESTGCTRSRELPPCAYAAARDCAHTPQEHRKRSKQSVVRISGRWFEKRPWVDHKRCNTWLVPPSGTVVRKILLDGSSTVKDSGLCAEGIRQIRELSPDLVFLDIQIPLQGRQFKVSKHPRSKTVRSDSSIDCGSILSSPRTQSRRTPRS